MSLQAFVALLLFPIIFHKNICGQMLDVDFNSLINNNVTAMALDAITEASAWVAAAVGNLDDLTGGQVGTVLEDGRKFILSDRFTTESLALDREQAIFDRAIQNLLDSANIPYKDALRTLLPYTKNKCPVAEIPCGASKYRSINGSCNNLLHPNWGQRGRAQARLIPIPAYEDGVSEPRGGLRKSRLPNPRLISTQIHPDVYVEFPGITNLAPNFGQFFDHDMSFTTTLPLPCCAGLPHPNCWPIPVPSNDSFYAPRGVTCLDFLRSTACIDTNGTRQQYSMATAFVDGSQFYGPTNDRAKLLRAGKGGRLVVNNKYSEIHLPLTSEVRGTLTVGDFLSGDERCNENPVLATLHNIFFREHNRVAELIEQKRPDWDDEKIYQEARRIVGAEIQAITYGEYLPIILGPHIMRQYGLEISRSQSNSNRNSKGKRSSYYTSPVPMEASGMLSPGRRTDQAAILPDAVNPSVPITTTYDPRVNPTILIEFTTAAFRFGHTLISGVIPLIHTLTRQQMGFFELKHEYFRSDLITEEDGRGYDYLVTSLLQSEAQNFDRYFTQALTNHLFLPPSRRRDYGADLVALNIQRGRDHGIHSYNSYRRFCGLPPLNSFSPPLDFPRHLWKKLLSIYKDPEDIDLYTGGFLELRANGGITGATFQCIMAIQFQRLKYGDRYFFTHANQEGSFTLQQIQELSRRRMSDVICNNGIQPYVQANAFRTPSSSNPYVSCNDTSRNLDIDLLLS